MNEAAEAKSDGGFYTEPFHGWVHRFNTMKERNHFVAMQDKWCKDTRDRYEADSSTVNMLRARASRLNVLASWVDMFEGKVV